jgi:ubiquinone/menaquinone biosynthesis C-methylase UbiE
MKPAEANHWLDDRCARAFWDQRNAVPYQELLRDTADLVDPKPGESWLDLGCGGGQLTGLLWRKSQGRVGRIIALDCAAANARALSRLRDRLAPVPGRGQIEFVQGNFSDGLGVLAEAQLDGVVSGLAISYAESRDPCTGQYTDYAYNRTLTEVHRVLKPSGQFVFSVNVPQPHFWRIFWKSLRVAFQLSKPAKVLINTLRMQRYGRWLRQEAKRGRFHFFSLPEIICRVQNAGFEIVETRLSYAGQAYLVCARKRPSGVPGAGHDSSRAA